MIFRRIILGASMAMAALALAACENKPADGAAVAQGSAPKGTISDELPDMQLLPNDAPLADPADLPPMPGLPVLPVDPAATAPTPDAATPAPAAPATSDEPAEEGDSVAE